MIVKLQFYSDIGFIWNENRGKTKRDRNDARISKLANKRQKIERAPIGGTSLQSLPSSLKLFAATQLKKEWVFWRDYIDAKSLNLEFLCFDHPSITGACSCKHYANKKKSSTTRCGYECSVPPTVWCTQFPTADPFNIYKAFWNHGCRIE